MYELTGLVKKVCDEQKFASGFSKRDLIVVEDRQGGWENIVSFSFKKENASKLDNLVPGAHVKVGFVVDGREWTDPKTGKVKYFSDLTGLKLDIVSYVTADKQMPESDNVVDDDTIPF